MRVGQVLCFTHRCNNGQFKLRQVVCLRSSCKKMIQVSLLATYAHFLSLNWLPLEHNFKENYFAFVNSILQNVAKEPDKVLLTLYKVHLRTLVLGQSQQTFFLSETHSERIAFNRCSHFETHFQVLNCFHFSQSWFDCFLIKYIKTKGT